MTPAARSRRERPSKRALSLEWIVAETVTIMEAEGLDKVTMRRVAQALDTGPASLYVYVANTAELHAAVLDSLIRPLTVPQEGDWDERLVGLLRSYGALLHAHRGLARSAIRLKPNGPNFVVLYDQILGLLIEAGIDVVQAAWGVNVLLQYVTADAAEHSDNPDTNGIDDLRRTLGGADPALTPHVATYANELISGNPEDRWMWGLQVLLAGITRTPVPSSALGDSTAGEQE